MFIKTHKDNTIMLTFLQSDKINAYPCGRRRSSPVDKDGDTSNTTDDIYYIPFDPEARLNTEANNRKHSSLNGFTQTYIKDWNGRNKLLTLSLAGYLFNITLPESTLTINGVNETLDFSEQNNFGRAIIACLVEQLTTLKSNAEQKNDIENVTSLTAEKTAVEQATRLYANILLEDVHLFSGFKDYYTRVLRNQSDGEPKTSLDLLKASGSVSNPDDYYFSGLSFSTIPLTSIVDGAASEITRDSLPRTYTRSNGQSSINVNQQIVSLCILEKEGSSWIIHQPALLPKIDHGTTEDSIVVYGDTTLKGNGKKLTVEGTAEVVGDTTIYSDLKVEDNINVGTPATPAEGDNGGCIVAESNITAEQNITAKNNLYVEVDAEVANTFKVKGLNDAEADRIIVEEDITITASKLTINNDLDILNNKINTKDLDSTGTMTANLIGTDAEKVTKVTASEASIDKLTAGNITLGKTDVTENLTVTGTITAINEDLGENVNNIEAYRADIDRLTGTTATIATINSDDIQQKIGEGDDADYYDIPVMFIKKDNDDKYQLKLCRVNKVNF